MNFRTSINKAAEFYKNFKEETVGIISHNDTDGITSAAIIAKALQRAGTKFHIHFITRTEDDILDVIKKKNYKVFFLLDYGSKEINQIAKEIPDKTFFVLDHHPIDEKADYRTNARNINPYFYNIDGGKDVCGATICYLFARALNEKNKDLSALAIVGAVGDSQRKDGEFSGPNKEIFEQALKEGFVTTKKGLKFYGWSSRPLHKALEYSTDPFIPSISGSESAAVKFLQEIGINLKKEDDSWKTINDLTDDEKKKLATALIAKRYHVENPANIFEDKIILPKFEIPELREAEVLSATLNSCAKLEKFGIAFGVAMGNKKDFEESKEITRNYKKQIIDAMNYFYDNRKNEQIVKETEHAIYFLGKDKMDSNLAGTVATILSFNLEASGKAIFCFGKADSKLKISSRYIGKKGKVSLGEVCAKIAANLGGEGGGHDVAAGATIPIGKEEMFINEFEKELNNGKTENKTN
ncbi:hypothetical protein GF374_02195 [Candidatus Woesearchaeota archaeon]|nr:hypothetical protein [Candidatus Woesearchaeota archaeon]